MSFLQGLATGFLSFLLFLSLLVFGLALTLNVTALSVAPLAVSYIYRRRRPQAELELASPTTA